MPASNGTSTTSTSSSKKLDNLRVLLIPFFATTHMQPFTELAISLASANEAIEATMAVTPANVSIVQSLLDREQHGNMKITSYPFPGVDGLPKGVENMGKTATPDDSLRIVLAAINESVMRPVQEPLIRAQCPDAIVTDFLFPWNSGIADELGVPCVAFNVIDAFPMLSIWHLADDDGAGAGNDDDVVEVPRFPNPPIRIVRRELPEWIRKEQYSVIIHRMNSLEADCFGIIMNTPLELEKKYCEVYAREGYVKRAYFVGPLALLQSSSSSSPPPPPAETEKDYIMEWLETKPDHSVVYVSFGTTAHVKDAQLDEISLGLEVSGESFLWVVRGKEEWSPPKGWEERVHGRGLIIRTWAPQTAILAHPATGAFVTQCWWNSMQETVAAGMPVLTCTGGKLAFSRGP